MRLIIIGFLITLNIACGGSSENAPSSPPPVQPTLPALTVNDTSNVEGTTINGVIRFSAQLSSTSTQVISVNYATQNGTALAGEDYIAKNGTLEIAAGQSGAVIEVIIIADDEEEQNEQFSIQLSNAQGARLESTQALATIQNDDITQQISGLSSRPDNQSCFVPEQPPQQSNISIVQVYNSLPRFNQPVKLLQEPFVGGRWFVLEKGGLLKVIDYDSPQSAEVFIDLSNKVNTESEGGLLGLAFHPQYPMVPEIFLYYTAPHSNPPMRSIISRWILDDIDRPTSPTEQVIIEIDQDFNNHNGGDIGFGSDGLLYIGLGDGGSGGDPNNRAQNTRYLLGSMLRIDVISPNANFPQQAYTIPPDNPFAQNPKCGPASNAQSCPEIFAWGLRNPFRWSFDSATGDIWLADVGQGTSEEINKILKGGNYGWRCEEGFDPFNQNGCSDGLEPPLSVYGRGQGNSVTGGWLYRGSDIPSLQGKYLFADFGSGRIWSLITDEQGQYQNNELLNSTGGITSFAPDHNGELYVSNFFDGRLYRLQSIQSPQQSDFPQLLSQTGCVNMNNTNVAMEGTIPYQPRVSFWSDGATKQRYIALPNTTQIGFSVSGNWDYPEGSVLIKHFQIEQRLIETRLLMRHENGNWGGYTYQWNSMQTEASRVIGGNTINLEFQQYRIPSEDECLACHTPAAGVVLGFNTKQLNHEFNYPETGITANQIATLAEIDILAPAPSEPISSLPSLVDVNDNQIEQSSRARAYLDANCANCHQPGAVVRSSMDLRFSAPLNQTNTCGVAPQLGSLGLDNANIISPGDSSRSVLIERMRRRDVNAMPPIASHIVDQQGVELLSSWINQMTNCS